MTLLTNLTATPVQGDYREAAGVRSAVYDSPAPGFIRLITFGAAGLVITHGKDQAAIPLSEILRAAESANPRLAPPPSATGETT